MSSINMNTQWRTIWSSGYGAGFKFHKESQGKFEYNCPVIKFQMKEWISDPHPASYRFVFTGVRKGQTGVVTGTFELPSDAEWKIHNNTVKNTFRMTFDPNDEGIVYCRVKVSHYTQKEEILEQLGIASAGLEAARKTICMNRIQDIRKRKTASCETSDMEESGADSRDSSMDLDGFSTIIASLLPVDAAAAATLGPAELDYDDDIQLNDDLDSLLGKPLPL